MKTKMKMAKRCQINKDIMHIAQPSCARAKGSEKCCDLSGS